MFIVDKNKLAIKRGEQGFTLIELLIVVIIVGILAAIALPNMLKQVSRAREAEAKNNLGAINRAQEVFNFDNGVFSTSIQALSVRLTGGSYVGSNYETDLYIYSVDGIPTATEAHHLATPQPLHSNEIKVFAAAIFKSSPTITSEICEANEPNITPQIVNTTICNNATPQPLHSNEIKVFAAAIFKSSPTITSEICEANEPNITPQIVNTTICNNGKLLR